MATEAGVFSGNVGNFLFSESVIKALSTPSTEVVANAMLTERGRVTDAYVDAINAEFDQFVVPLANAFRPDFQRPLDQLTAVIERLDIPVVVTGVGGQHGVEGGVGEYSDALQQSIRRFAGAVLDRSASIGVRGELTKRLLVDLGLPAASIDVIGCPSLHSTPTPRVVEKTADGISPDSPIAINLTPEVARIGRILLSNMERYPHMTYVPQERGALALMLWGERDTRYSDRNMPTYWDHPMHLANRMRFPLDARTWFELLEQQEFVFGTRLHGNIAALIAGTPAFLLVHDSRTLELARYHALPHAMIDEVDADVDPRALYERADFTEFNARRRETFDTYLRFLERNGVEHVFAQPEAQRQWEVLHGTIEYPPLVQTLLAEPSVYRKAVADRLAWLRQGNGVDEHRRVGGYRPDFATGVSLPPLNPGRDLHRQLDATQAVQKQLRAQQVHVKELRQQIKRLEREVRPIVSTGRLARATLPASALRAARWIGTRFLRARAFDRAA